MFKVPLLLLAVAISTVTYAADKTTTLEGRLVSASCYLTDHSNTGNEMYGAKECGTGCLKQGKPGGLLTKDNAFYLLDAPSLPLARYVGQQIRVTGEEHGSDIISARKVMVQKGSGWESVDISYHPEK